MNKSEQIVEYVRQHPGCTHKDISVGTGISIEYTTNRAKILADSHALERVPVGKTITNKPIYGYTVANPTQQKEVGNVTHSKEIAAKSLDGILTDFVSGFAKSLVGAIVDQLKPQLERELRAALPAALPAIPSVPQETKEREPVQEFIQRVESKARLPVVGIVGVHPPKRGPLLSEFSDVFELVFWCTEDKEHVLRSMAHRCEVIYVMDYVGHKHTMLLQSRGANLRRVHGDIAKLCEMLTQQFLGQEA